MFQLLLTIPIICGIAVGVRDGVLAGLAAGAVATLVELTLLFALGALARRSAARKPVPAPAAAHSAAHATAPDTAAYAETTRTDTLSAQLEQTLANARRREILKRRDTDRNRPVDTLPRPIGTVSACIDEVNPQTLPGYLGDAASYEQLTLAVEGRQALNRELYDGLRRTFERHVEIESNVDEQAPDIAPVEDFREHFFVRGVDDNLFVAFRSRDAQWAGFRVGRDSFRFPLERLVGIALTVGQPARGGGCYHIDVVFDAPQRDTSPDARWRHYNSTLDLSLTPSDRYSNPLLFALTRIAHLFDVRIVCDTYMDV